MENEIVMQKPQTPHIKMPQQNHGLQETCLSPQQIQRIQKPTYSFIERFNNSNSTLGKIIQIDEKSGEYKNI